MRCDACYRDLALFTRARSAGSTHPSGAACARTCMSGRTGIPTGLYFPCLLRRVEPHMPDSRAISPWSDRYLSLMRQGPSWFTGVSWMWWLARCNRWRRSHLDLAFPIPPVQPSDDNVVRAYCINIRDPRDSSPDVLICHPWLLYNASSQRCSKDV